MLLMIFFRDYDNYDHGDDYDDDDDNDDDSLIILSITILLHPITL